MKKFLVSTADVYGYDSNDNLLFVGKTLLDSSIETTLSNTDVRAGRGNQLQYIYYHSAEMNITVNEAQFSLDFLALNTGSAITTGANIWTEESVTVTNGAGTVTEGTPLSGAEFNLLSGDTAQWFLPGDTAGVYYLANEGDTKGEVATAPETKGGEEPVTATQTLSVDEQGKLYIYGLDEGTYKLQETKAPDGYNLKTEADTIVITDTDKDGKLDGQVGGQNVDPNGTGIYTITVKNSQGFQLPVTGGIGTVVFAATGIVVVGLGMTLLMIVFKKNRAAK